MSYRSAEVTYEILGGDHNERIIAALRAAGYNVVIPECELHPNRHRL